MSLRFPDLHFGVTFTGGDPVEVIEPQAADLELIGPRNIKGATFSLKHWGFVPFNAGLSPQTLYLAASAVVTTEEFNTGPGADALPTSISLSTGNTGAIDYVTGAVSGLDPHAPPLPPNLNGQGPWTPDPPAPMPPETGPTTDPPSGVVLDSFVGTVVSGTEVYYLLNYRAYWTTFNPTLPPGSRYVRHYGANRKFRVTITLSTPWTLMDTAGLLPAAIASLQANVFNAMPDGTTRPVTFGTGFAPTLGASALIPATEFDPISGRTVDVEQFTARMYAHQIANDTTHPHGGSYAFEVSLYWTVLRGGYSLLISNGPDNPPDVPFPSYASTSPAKLLRHGNGEEAVISPPAYNPGTTFDFNTADGLSGRLFCQLRRFEDVPWVERAIVRPVGTNEWSLDLFGLWLPNAPAGSLAPWYDIQLVPVGGGAPVPLTLYSAHVGGLYGITLAHELHVPGDRYSESCSARAAQSALPGGRYHVVVRTDLGTFDGASDETPLTVTVPG